LPVATALVLLLSPTPSHALELPEWADNEYYKLSLNVRARIELAELDGAAQSEAYTVRTLFGIGSKPYHGLSVYAELENSFSFDDGEYFDAVEAPTGQTVIADPENTDLNQAYLKYEHAALGGSQFIGGRQRIKLDNDRFIGNVGWRQNEQVYDAVQTSSALGLEGLKLTYGYIWEVLRIFGDDGAPALHDFDSDSHFVRAAYTMAPQATIVLFAYLLDFDNSPGNSANSYGARLTGSADLSDSWATAYELTTALQTDAGDNAVNYTAAYVAAEASLRNACAGGFTLGYELLGSDDGDARFVTPLATAHQFNGFADVFVDNGGTDGLQDLYVGYAPPLPGKFGDKLKGELTYHRFWSDEGSDELGGELDAVVIYGVTEYLSVLSKAAYFDGTSDGPADVWRWWLEATLRL
jgi:hypothetical protein